MVRSTKEIDLMQFLASSVKLSSVPSLQWVIRVDVPLEMDMAVSLSLLPPLSEPLVTSTLLCISEGFFGVSA